MQVFSMYDMSIAQCMTVPTCPSLSIFWQLFWVPGHLHKTLAGVLQFLATYRRMQHLENDPFFYGDELVPWLSLRPSGLRWSKGPRVRRVEARLSRS